MKNRGMKSLCLTWVFLMAVAGSAEPALRVVRSTETGTGLLSNGCFEEMQATGQAHWHGWGKGFRTAASEGRNGSHAVVCERGEGNGEFGPAKRSCLIARTSHR